MTTRKIKDAKDLSTDELIYFKSHAKATYMSNGSTVEDAINNISVGEEIDLTGYATENYVNEAVSSKQNNIDDLDTIRSGAVLGATALQPESISDMETKTNAASTYITKIDAASIYATKDDIQKIPIVNHGTQDTTFELTPNILHVWETVSSLTLTLAAITDPTIANYYMFEFISGSTATTLSLPSTISWQNDISVEANKTYQISILNNCGVIGGF